MDGNKRTALAAALVFLDTNGIELEDPKEELYGLMMKVANGQTSKTEIARKFLGLKKKKGKR